MEILAKFGSALSGFWWALDDHERRMLVLSGAYLVGVVFYFQVRVDQRQKELDELADLVAERLNHG